MVKSRKIMIAGAAALFSVFSGFAQLTGINIDAKTAARITSNLVMQMAVESPHNQTLDSIENTQQKISFQSMEIMTARQLNLMSQKDSNGFDVESPFYKTIFKLSTDIAARIPKVVSKISKTSWAGKTRMMIEVGNMLSDCVALTNDFRNIVTNCKVKPVLENQSVNTQKDGPNLLDRDERLNIAISIITKLRAIQTKLIRMGYYADYATWSDVLYAFDRETWCNLIYGKSLGENIVSEWNALAKWD